MKIQEPSDSLRKMIQKNLYKIMLTSIAVSIIVFSINREGFFFGIH